MELTGPFLTVGIALGLGMLVGLQRERAMRIGHFGGIRTVPLVTVLGAITTMLIPTAGPWLAVAAFVGVVVAVALGNFIVMHRGDPEPGMTTEVAMMVMFVIGVMIATDLRDLGVALGVAVAVLLQLKERLHALARKVGDEDMRAVLQFALITFIVLPVLPDETYGPFDVLNPYRIWLMVVLVVGIGLAGYVAFRVLGRTSGVIVAGLIGGLISSTATTVSYARRAGAGVAVRRAAVSIFLLATLVMYVRVIGEVLIVSPTRAWDIAGPLVVMAGLTLVCAGASLLARGEDSGELPEQSNPAELKSALVFGGLYGLVLLLVSAAREWVGESGIYLVAAVSGLTDMDAITLSNARLVERGVLEPGVAWRAVVIASVSNLLFKLGMVWSLGGARLAGRAGAWFGILGVAGILLVLFW